MKKVILSALVLTGIISTANAQSIWTENYTAATLGNATTVTNGSAAGYGGVYYLQGAPSDYKIADGGAPYGNALEIYTGSGVASEDQRIILKEVTVAPAANSTFVKGTFDFFTGWGGGFGRSLVILTNPDSTNSTIGGIGYDNVSKTILGMGKFIKTSTGAVETTLYGLVNNITDATWIKLGFIYNKTTGQIIWSLPTGNLTLNSTSGNTPIPNQSLDTIEIHNFPMANNFGFNDFAYDNINFEYSDNATLNLEELPILATGVKVYPNPTTDVLKITAKSKVDSVEIFDLSGKKIVAEVKNNEVDVRSYTPGTYLINVITKDGKTMTKFIKN